MSRFGVFIESFDTVLMSFALDLDSHVDLYRIVSIVTTCRSKTQDFLGFTFRDNTIYIVTNVNPRKYLCGPLTYSQCSSESEY